MKLFVASVLMGFFFLNSSLFAGSSSSDWKEKYSLANILKESGKFNTLLAALEVTGLDAAVSSGQTLTILAPTDKAFEKLGAETIESLINDPETLSSILLYHVIPDRVYLRQALQLGTAATLNENTVTFAKKGFFNFTVNDSRIIYPNIGASNGVIHAIDTVLLPPAPPALESIFFDC